MEFDRCISPYWVASTLAVSEKKAKSNLIYQYKKQTGRAATAKILLPGKIELVD